MAVPRTISRLLIMLPVIEALTTGMRLARRAATPRMSSLALPQVASIRPAARGPLRAARARVALPSTAARGINPTAAKRKASSGVRPASARPSAAKPASSIASRMREPVGERRSVAWCILSVGAGPGATWRHCRVRAGRPASPPGSQGPERGVGPSPIARTGERTSPAFSHGTLKKMRRGVISAALVILSLGATAWGQHLPGFLQRKNSDFRTYGKITAFHLNAPLATSPPLTDFSHFPLKNFSYPLYPTASSGEAGMVPGNTETGDPLVIPVEGGLYDH